ncbi:YheC/YheD family protein [Mycoplasmatota bacterium WC44]
MRQKYNILPNLQFRNRLTVPDCKLISDGRIKGYIRFGHYAREIDIVRSNEISNDQILVSQNIIEELNIPTASNYEIRFDGIDITIGPYIGILVCKRQENLDLVVQNLSNYLYDYDDIGGLVIAFSQEGIDIEKEMIKGYAYNPQSTLWEEGTFYYPSSIFRRAGLSDKKRNFLHSRLGDRMFNNYIFDKWEMHKWLSNSMQHHLPETIRYENPKDIIWFLSRFNTAYIKPIYGSQGMGIMKVTRENDIYKLEAQVDNKDIVKYFETDSKLMTHLKGYHKNKRYIIQEGIDVIKKDNMMIDFRVLLVKNYSGKWTEMGIIGRYGEKARITSNISSGGNASMGNEVLRDILNLTEEQILKLRSKMKKMVIEAAEKIESCGIHCGNFGFDIAIDKNYKLWIIEINNKDPNHTIAIDAGNRELFYKTKKMNMLYAKKLAGF